MGVRRLAGARDPVARVVGHRLRFEGDNRSLGS